MGGSPEGFSGDVNQTNAVVQIAKAEIDNEQKLKQIVDIKEFQKADASDDAEVLIVGPFAENDSMATSEDSVGTNNKHKGIVPDEMHKMSDVEDEE